MYDYELFMLFQKAKHNDFDDDVDEAEKNKKENRGEV